MISFFFFFRCHFSISSELFLSPKTFLMARIFSRNTTLLAMKNVCRIQLQLFFFLFVYFYFNLFLFVLPPSFWWPQNRNTDVWNRIPFLSLYCNSFFSVILCNKSECRLILWSFFFFSFSFRFELLTIIFSFYFFFVCQMKIYHLFDSQWHLSIFY